MRAYEHTEHCEYNKFIVSFTKLGGDRDRERRYTCNEDVLFQWWDGIWEALCH